MERLHDLLEEDLYAALAKLKSHEGTKVRHRSRQGLGAISPLCHARLDHPGSGKYQLLYKEETGASYEWGCGCYERGPNLYQK